MTPTQKVRACLWFDHEAKEAANFISLIPDSRILSAYWPSMLRSRRSQFRCGRSLLRHSTTLAGNVVQIAQRL